MVTLRILRSFRGPVRCVLSAAFLVTAGAVGVQTQTNQISSRFSAEAMTAAGTPVSYVKPTVLDENGKPLPVECNPKSGAVFPLGTTDVACTAPNNFSTTLTVTVADTRAPLLHVPGAASPAHEWTFDLPRPAAAGVMDVTANVAWDTGFGPAPVHGAIQPGAVRRIVPVCAAGDPQGGKGGVVSFDGSIESYIDFGVGLGAPGARDFSFSLWLSAKSQGEVRLLTTRSENASDYFELALAGSGAAVFELSDGAGPAVRVEGGQVPRDGTWHHVEARRAGKKTSLIVDGVVVAESESDRVLSLDTASRFTASSAGSQWAAKRITADFDVIADDDPLKGIPNPFVGDGTCGQTSGQIIAVATDLNGALVDFGPDLFAIDLVDPLPTIECSAKGAAVISGHRFDLGSTPVTCTAIDRHGNLATRSFTVTVLPSPSITCAEATCAVRAGQTMGLHGDSSAAALRYHRWEWTDASIATVAINRDALATGYASDVIFSAERFSGADTRTVTLTACDRGFGLGTCGATTRVVEITPAPAVSIVCSPADCAVRAGGTMRLQGDSSAAAFRYHRWEWMNASGAVVATLIDTLGGFTSDVPFSAGGFDGAATTRVTVRFEACSGGFGAGSCASDTEIITVQPAAPPTISCTGGDCRVQAGLTLALTGESVAAGLRYHTWRWRDSAGVEVVSRVDGGAPLTSSVLFRADGFSGSAERTVTLSACGSGFDSGTCTTATRTIQITAAPPPVISCAGGSCTVGAGSTIDLTGDSSGAGFRYHSWRWVNAAGVTVTVNRDTAGAFLSTVTFDATGFGAADVTPVEVALSSCTGGFRMGSCVSASITLTILSARQIISRLLGDVAKAGFQPGSRLLRNVIKQLDAGRIVPACAELRAFSILVRAQDGRRLTHDDAARFLGAAPDARRAIGCAP